jgi:hypothetical protein
MALGRFWRFKVARPIVRSVTPPQSMIELAVDLRALLAGVVAHLAGLGALEFDLMIGTKGFDHCIEALTGPWYQLGEGDGWRPNRGVC